MPYVTVPTEQEKQILRGNGMNPKDFGVTHRDVDTIRLICYATRDNFTMKVKPMPHVTAPDKREEQILRENGMNPKNYGVTYRDADTARLLCYATRDTITIDRGDRKW